MSASLRNVGATQLNKSGNVKLSELNSSDAETRVFTTYGYLRVNSFEMADGDAPTPAAQPGAGGNAQLSDWDGYLQWDAARAAGNTLDCTALDWDSANFSWVKPSNYDDFPSAEVRQQLWCKQCATQSLAGCEADDPLNGSAFATTDGSTGVASGLTHLTWYTCAVVMNWDDDGDSGWERESDPYGADSTPTNGFDDVDAIIIETENTTTTTPACLGNGEPCTGCPTNSDCCSGWCDQFGGGCQPSEPTFC